MATKTGMAAVLAKVGTQANLARLMKLSRQVVSHWKVKDRIPVERLKDVEAATGISRRRLRPDIFG